MDNVRIRARENLPDTPRWVETRDLLARDNSHILGEPHNFVVWNVNDEIGSVVGQPKALDMQTAIADCCEILAFPENFDHVHHHLAMLNPERASILKASPSFIAPSLHPCDFLQRDELKSTTHLPHALYEELSDVIDAGKDLYAAFEGQLPVAFCYVASETESLWDISIDTLASHRRRGFGLSAAAGLIQHMNTKGKAAVWGAVESNLASHNLALKLGFIEVDTIWVLSRLPEA